MEINEIIKSINEAMKPEIADWQQLTDEELEKVHYVQHKILDDIDFHHAYRDGVISKGQMDKINAFEEWNESLGGLTTKI
ncbi:hypothetical protein HNR65_003420 [Desulfosalsimonas propionicica]|uniref:Uncharacterized protein n=1 Tax=Desulfosalsimonas propionicica TaxID=332175 RepID=A0A7W0CC67_9BACT|nr:hypothetical protein [Desulfosalsimonas propionicica]MBA2883063.1 hypothetical protein [Desulfosalsimonas propionicica]